MTNNSPCPNNQPSVQGSKGLSLIPTHIPELEEFYYQSLEQSFEVTYNKLQTI